MLNVLVLGAGAVGAFYGYHLSEAGARVSVVCRSTFDDVKKKGFCIQSDGKKISFQPDGVYQFGEVIDDLFDVVLVTTKAVSDVNLVSCLRQVPMQAKATIVLMQNGIDIETEVVNSFSDYSVLSGISFVCLERQQDGGIDHRGFGKVVLSPFLKSYGCATRLVELFSSQGILCEMDDDVRFQRWRKLVWNVPFNALAVLAGNQSTLFLLNDAAYCRQIRAVMAEVILIANEDGCCFDADIIDQLIINTRKMGDYYPSMVWDAKQGRTMEIDAILGAVLVYADRYDLSVPLIRQLYQDLSCFKLS